MAPPTQTNRFLAVDTSLGPDKLLLRSFSMNDQLGRLFQLELEMDGPDNSTVNAEKIMGTSATVRLTMPDLKTTRYFNGIVTRFVQQQDGKLTRYRATLSPWLWLLTRSADCRIYQNKTAPDIIEAIFKQLGFSDYKLRLSANYNPREFCVQYRETEFNFVSRLMEEEGIYYYFLHQNGKHTLILADSPSAHDPFPGYDKLNYRPSSGKQVPADSVTDWIVEKEIQPGTYKMCDYNFVTPKSLPNGNSTVSRQHEHDSYEVFDYPGGFQTTDQGSACAKVRIDELQAQYEILHGQGTVFGVATGSKFTLQGHPRADQGRNYLLISTSIQASAGAYASSQSGGQDFLSSSFSAIPLASDKPPLPFRTPRTTPKPLIRGPQTAVVVGSSGAEIETDEYGRVKVHFHWDRYDKKDQNSSCFIRVAQNWAGKQWGSMYIPRVGQEVVVEFLEGDPDRPIITGSVYNADQTVPYTLPANKTQSGIKSRSTTGGSTDTFNELRFEDKAGSELVFFQAQKDLTVNIKNDRTETIKGKETKEVDKDVTETFKANHTENTTNKYSLKADTLEITGQTKITLTVGGNSITIDSNGIKINSSATLDMESSGTAKLSASGTMQISGAMTSINS